MINRFRPYVRHVPSTTVYSAREACRRFSLIKFVFLGPRTGFPNRIIYLWCDGTFTVFKKLLFHVVDDIFLTVNVKHVMSKSSLWFCSMVSRSGTSRSAFWYFGVFCANVSSALSQIPRFCRAFVLSLGAWNTLDMLGVSGTIVYSRMGCRLAARSSKVLIICSW